MRKQLLRDWLKSRQQLNRERQLKRQLRRELRKKRRRPPRKGLMMRQQDLRKRMIKDRHGYRPR